MYSPFKMKGKSPMMKALIGKQNRLPEELKKEILASPAKMKKPAGRGGAKLTNRKDLANMQKRQEETRMIKGVEKARAMESARKRKPKPGGALKMKKK